MVNELGIVFLHHDKGQIALNNLASFRRVHPGVPIVTVSAEDSFRGGYSIRDWPEWAVRWDELEARVGSGRSGDLLVYAWYEHRRETAKRWLFVEWDTFCNMDTREYFGDVWDDELVAHDVIFPDREWYWWRFARSVQGACGVAPFSLMLVSDTALSRIVAAVPDELSGNSELRFGSIANQLGIKMTARVGAGMNDWQALHEGTNLTAGMWHPVKWFAQPGQLHWGRAKWAALHFFAKSFVGKAVEERLVRDWLENWGADIPCGMCKAEWGRLYAGLSNADLASGNAFYTWTIKIHDEVNAKLGKPYFHQTAVI